MLTSKEWVLGGVTSRPFQEIITDRPNGRTGGLIVKDEYMDVQDLYRAVSVRSCQKSLASWGFN